MKFIESLINRQSHEVVVRLPARNGRIPKRSPTHSERFALWTRLISRIYQVLLRQSDRHAAV